MFVVMRWVRGSWVFIRLLCAKKGDANRHGKEV